MKKIILTILTISLMIPGLVSARNYNDLSEKVDSMLDSNVKIERVFSLSEIANEWNKDPSTNIVCTTDICLGLEVMMNIPFEKENLIALLTEYQNIEQESLKGQFVIGENQVKDYTTMSLSDLEEEFLIIFSKELANGLLYADIEQPIFQNTYNKILAFYRNDGKDSNIFYIGDIEIRGTEEAKKIIKYVLTGLKMTKNLYSPGAKSYLETQINKEQNRNPISEGIKQNYVEFADILYLILGGGFAKNLGVDPFNNNEITKPEYKTLFESFMDYYYISNKATVIQRDTAKSLGMTFIPISKDTIKLANKGIDSEIYTILEEELVKPFNNPNKAGHNEAMAVLMDYFPNRQEFSMEEVVKYDKLKTENEEAFGNAYTLSIIGDMLIPYGTIFKGVAIGAKFAVIMPVALKSARTMKSFKALRSNTLALLGKMNPLKKAANINTIKKEVKVIKMYPENLREPIQMKKAAGFDGIDPNYRPTNTNVNTARNSMSKGNNPESASSMNQKGINKISNKSNATKNAESTNGIIKKQVKVKISNGTSKDGNLVTVRTYENGKKVIITRCKDNGTLQQIVMRDKYGNRIKKVYSADGKEIDVFKIGVDGTETRLFYGNLQVGFDGDKMVLYCADDVVEKKFNDGTITYDWTNRESGIRHRKDRLNHEEGAGIFSNFDENGKRVVEKEIYTQYDDIGVVKPENGEETKIFADKISVRTIDENGKVNRVETKDLAKRTHAIEDTKGSKKVHLEEWDDGFKTIEESQNGEKVRNRTFDDFGRISEIDTDSRFVKYTYLEESTKAEDIVKIEKIDKVKQTRSVVEFGKGKSSVKNISFRDKSNLEITRDIEGRVIELELELEDGSTGMSKTIHYDWLDDGRVIKQEILDGYTDIKTVYDGEKNILQKVETVVDENHNVLSKIDLIVPKSLPLPK